MIKLRPENSIIAARHGDGSIASDESRVTRKHVFLYNNCPRSYPARQEWPAHDEPDVVPHRAD